MTLQEIKNHQSPIFSLESKISIPWVTNYALEATSSNSTLNEFVSIKSTILNLGRL